MPSDLTLLLGGKKRTGSTTCFLDNPCHEWLTSLGLRKGPGRCSCAVYDASEGTLLTAIYAKLVLSEV